VEKTVKEKIVKHQKVRRASVVSGLMVSTVMLAGLLTFPSVHAQGTATEAAKGNSPTLVLGQHETLRVLGVLDRLQ